MKLINRMAEQNNMHLIVPPVDNNSVAIIVIIAIEKTREKFKQVLTET